MNIEEYRNTFMDNTTWFKDEINKPYHVTRISNVVENKNYLKGIHKILEKEDATYKTKKLITRKTIIQYAKTVLNFHATYLLGKQVSLSGDEEIKKAFADIYKNGLYATTDYQILDRVNKYGDAFEYVYFQDGKTKSKVFDSGDCYPVYTDSGDYIAFIEHWTDAFSSVSYWNVYYPTYVEHWDNEGGEENLRNTTASVTGLPIHYHNVNEDDYNFGESILNDIKPLMDELEDILSKMSDAIYVNSLSPMNVVTGERIENTVPADAIGFALNLDQGSDYKVVSTMMDYNTIKLYLDNVKEFLNQVSCVPSVLGNSNVANVSEVSLKMLFHLAMMKAMETEKWLNIGFADRFEKFKKILALQNKSVSGNVGIEYNLSIPSATNEVINNLKSMKEMGAISNETIMEKSELITDVAGEKKRIESETVPLKTGVDNV